MTYRNISALFHVMSNMRMLITEVHVLPGANPASNIPRNTRQTIAPAGLKVVESSVDAVPHPITAQPIHILGRKSLEVMVIGIGKIICHSRRLVRRRPRQTYCKPYVGNEECGVSPVEEVARRVASKDILRESLQTSVSQVRPVQI